MNEYIDRLRTNWDTLPLKDKAEMMRVAIRNGITTLPEIKEAYNKFADGGNTDRLSNEEYYSIMERVAKDNNAKWNEERLKYGDKPLSVDEEYLRVLNDNSYDYRGYYNKYPNSAANADTHWTDEFKTVNHPSFSNESIYSPNNPNYVGLSQYNPNEIPGGYWLGDTHIPTAAQLLDRSRRGFADGGLMDTPDEYDEYIKHIRSRQALDRKNAQEAYKKGNRELYDTLVKRGSSYTEEEGNMLDILSTVRAERETYGKSVTYPGFNNNAYFDELKQQWILPRDKDRKQLKVEMHPTLINQKSNGGNLFLGGGPFESDKVLGRANRVFTNYEDAVDFDMNPAVYSVRDYMYENDIPHSGLSNCTLTATQWVDPKNPIGSAKTIVSNPTAYGYTPISQEDIIPGNLMISRNPETGSFHTMLIESVNPDGTPNLRYSTGGPHIDSLRSNISQKEYHRRDNEQGGNHTEDMFYRYNYPNEYWLPEVVVTADKKANGGNLFDDGGYTPSEAIIDRISKYEGKSMTGGYVDPLSHKVVKKNNSIANEARGFENALPASIRGLVLANSELADNLFSYSYNVGSGKFKSRVVPALERYFSGNGSADEIANSMWASGDKKLRGLQIRRAEERQGVINALGNNSIQSPQLPLYDESIFQYNAPVINQEDIAVTPKEEYIYNPIQERREALQNFSNVLAMLNGNDSTVQALNMVNNPLMAIANNFNI